MKYFVVTFGCQMNQSDSERIFQELKEKYQPASSIKEADLVVVNMCSVRQSAVDRVLGLKPKLKGKKTILTGCILKKDRKKFEEMFDEIKEGLGKTSQGTSALIPIMRGCNNFCSYCVVPFTRGRETFRPTEEIICEAERLIEQGTKEIWLLGQNVNSYPSFSKLLRGLNKIKGDFWIRFTSSHPKDFSDDIIKAMKECKKVSPYLNLPAQSGDNTILKKMNRPYTIEDYKKIIKKLRKQIPDITLSTDIIVGFPSETRSRFEKTKKLFEEIKYDMAYTNKYSPRTETKAFKLKDNVSQKEKARRERILTEVLKKTAQENNERFVNQTIRVLPTQEKKGFLIGKSFHYKTVKFKGNKRLIGSFVKVKITEALPWGLEGKYVK